MFNKTKIALILGAGLALTACGNTDLERGITGGAGGAVAGEVLFDAPVAGAAVGAAGGALTN